MTFLTRSICPLKSSDYLDVCLVHDPSSMDPVIAKDGALETLQRMQEEGLVKFIGLGVREHEFHKIAIETGIVDVILDISGLHTSESNCRWLVTIICE